MTNDNDLIRRGDVLDAMCKGPRTVQERIDIIRVIPAVAASQPDCDCPDTALCQDGCYAKQLAASQPANPVINADSRQRVMVKLLVWGEVNPGVFVAESSLGVWSRFDGHYMRPDASGGIASDNPEAAAQADYEARILAALDVQPDPRDAVIEKGEPKWPMI